MHSPCHSHALHEITKLHVSSFITHTGPNLTKKIIKQPNNQCLVIYRIANEGMGRSSDIKLAQMLGTLTVLFVYQLSILAGTFVTKSFF